jgi:membrane-bound lytic murein transglycosylase B
VRRSIARGTEQDEQQDSAQEAGARHAAGATRWERPRPRRRRRWLVVAAAVAAFSAMVAPPPQPVEADVDDAASQESVDDGVPTLPELSAGAPAGAITLASAPERDPDPEPATPAVITGLAANGIPNVALNAYRVAAARMSSAQPSCGIDWSLLAGIGRVESNHGRYGGAALQSDGTATPKILGPALDGVQFAYIADSDDGMWDGDTSYDRAMGPMQFIPTTWRAYAVDADGNGNGDPFNINDAALAAANYLCTAGGDLRTDAGQRRAVFAYNHSDSYVNQVLALARAYASGIPVADLGPMFGNTTSPVPPPSGSYWAPAAPGPAIGAKDRTPASGDTTGAQPQRRPSPAPAGGGTPPAQSGGAATGGATAAGSGTGGAAPPPPAPGPDQAASPPPSPGTAPAQPAPAPAPVPVPLPAPVPAPVPPPSMPKPLPPPPPLPDPGALIRGVTCGTALTVACPPGTP